jgi:hypothetical protein
VFVGALKKAVQELAIDGCSLERITVCEFNQNTYLKALELWEREEKKPKKQE